MKSLYAYIVLLTICMCADAKGAVTGELPGAIPSKISGDSVKGALPLRSRTLLGLVIGRHTLSDVVKRLGAAPIVKADRVDGRPNTVCFLSSTDDTLVVFEAGPLGGFETLTAATVAPRSAYALDAAKCGASRSIDRSSTRMGGLHLGASIAEVSRTLRAPGRAVSNGIVEISFERTTMAKRGTDSVEMDTTSGVVARASDDRVVWFSVYYIESM